MYVRALRGGLLQNESAREKPIKPARGSARHSHFTEARGHVQNASWSADPERSAREGDVCHLELL